MYYPRVPMSECEVVYFYKGNNERPLLLRQRSSQSFIVKTIALSLFVDVFVYAMLVPILPTIIVSRSEVLFEECQYWNSALLLSEAASTLIFSPIFGFFLSFPGSRQDLYFFGLVFLFGSMALFTTAQSTPWFIGAKVLQGAATSMTTLAGMEILTDAVDKHHLGELFSYVGTAKSLGLMFGPPIGSMIFQYGGFYAICGMAFGLIALDLVLRLAVIEKKVAARWITLPEYCPCKGHTYTSGYFSCETIFNRDQSRQRSDAGSSIAFFKLLGKPEIMISLWAVIIGGLVISAFHTTLPIFVQHDLHWDTLNIGFIFIPLSFGALLHPFFAWICERFGSRTIAFSSFVLLSPALISLHLIEQNTTLHKSIIYSLLAAVGLCLDICGQALLLEVQRALSGIETENPGIFGKSGAIAQAFGLQTVAHFGGRVLGPIQGGFMSFAYGWKVMTLGLGVLALLTAVPMLWLSAGSKNRSDEDAERQPLLGA
ncbi:hypothetical protein N7456_002472 [Penicillium angulare]|uniref:Major facilitator superfamily (MFS) profile domain-containing protein n=1 Tax=Penicillium angulare TaxID=116970 RepID=A0A9W9KQC6_9EURO|nr:hypothetical protein N7456_002472 [Penicillium angulare]